MTMKKQPDGIRRVRRGDAKEVDGKKQPVNEYDILRGAGDDEINLGHTAREGNGKWRAFSAKEGVKPWPEAFDNHTLAVEYLIQEWGGTYTPPAKAEPKPKATKAPAKPKASKTPAKPKAAATKTTAKPKAPAKSKVSARKKSAAQTPSTSEAAAPVAETPAPSEASLAAAGITAEEPTTDDTFDTSSSTEEQAVSVGVVSSDEPDADPFADESDPFA